MSIIISLLIFSFIIIFHELGHFLLARANHITVTEFSLGMGPRLLSHVTKSGTRVSLKLLPFGGSCMMLGEEEGPEAGDGCFAEKSVWARMSVVLAGPFFNFILAFLFSVILIGADGYDEPVVAEVIDDYPAQEAGLQSGDQIVALNGKKIHLFRDIGTYMMFHDDEAIEVTFVRSEEEQKVILHPQTDEYGNRLIGVRSGGLTKGGFLQTLQYAGYEMGYWISVTYKSIGSLITGKIGMDSLSGPVGVVSYIGQTYEASAKDGLHRILSSMINIMILLSANLGVMNLLPIPALDGGRFLFMVVEVIRGKRIPPEKEGIVNLIGFALLMALMVFVIFQDITTLIGG